MYQSIVTEIDNTVAIVTLNKPDRHNAFDDHLVAELTDALLVLQNDDRVRVVVLSAAGKSFCTGMDTNWTRESAGFTAEECRDDAVRLATLMKTLNELPKPTVARVQGPAYGNGLGLVAACDIAIASYDAQFAMTEAKHGLVPAVVSPYVVAAIGERHCRRYMLSAERFSAAEAYRLGLVHEIVPGDEQLDDAVGEVVENLLKNSPGAQSECKALLRAVAGQPIDESTIDETVRSIVHVRSTAEGKEGVAAFLEKRKPSWVRTGA
ncbi:enoyl-CoA hydratase/isomerase family protein [Propionivibrio soli]|uniref:enoyl-CoA hydratase/isomerase family protein n=1 Tax=Propionivibrio soli TaxID=2976531 RepID=UPI0021E80032|nr:enoyl-CoA hydratase/isomerase family protein [Propionivibrio soli]